MREPKLLSTLAGSKEAFDKLTPYLTSHKFSEFGELVYEQIQGFYTKDPEATKVDLDIVQHNLIKALPKKENYVLEFISALPDSASLPNVLEVFAAAKKEKLSLDIMQALAADKEKEARKLMDEYLGFRVEEVLEEEKVYNGAHIAEIEQQFTGENLIPIYPLALNEAIGGGLPRQSQFCIFARKDVGKTSAAINITYGAASNGHKVAYFGNEDADAFVLYRLLTRFACQPREELKKDPDKWMQVALENGYGNVYFIPLTPGTIPEIGKWVEKLRPDLVIVDQVRNLVLDKDGLKDTLEEAGKQLRNLAKKYYYVSGIVTQAGDSATNKLFLRKEDIDSSKTGLQASMDLIVGLGQNDDMRRRGQVMLNICSCKFSGMVQPLTCNIDYGINRIVGV